MNKQNFIDKWRMLNLSKEEQDRKWRAHLWEEETMELARQMSVRNMNMETETAPVTSAPVSSGAGGTPTGPVSLNGQHSTLIVWPNSATNTWNYIVYNFDTGSGPICSSGVDLDWGLANSSIIQAGPYSLTFYGPSSNAQVVFISSNGVLIDTTGIHDNTLQVNSGVKGTWASFPNDGKVYIVSEAHGMVEVDLTATGANETAWGFHFLGADTLYGVKFNGDIVFTLAYSDWWGQSSPYSNVAVVFTNENLYFLTEAGIQTFQPSRGPLFSEVSGDNAIVVLGSGDLRDIIYFDAINSTVAYELATGVSASWFESKSRSVWPSSHISSSFALICAHGSNNSYGNWYSFDGGYTVYTVSPVSGISICELTHTDIAQGYAIYDECLYVPVKVNNSPVTIEVAVIVGDSASYVPLSNVDGDYNSVSIYPLRNSILAGYNRAGDTELFHLRGAFWENLTDSIGPIQSASVTTAGAVATVHDGASDELWAYVESDQSAELQSLGQGAYPDLWSGSGLQYSDNGLDWSVICTSLDFIGEMMFITENGLSPFLTWPDGDFTSVKFFDKFISSDRLYMIWSLGVAGKFNFEDYGMDTFSIGDGGSDMFDGANYIYTTNASDDVSTVQYSHTQTSGSTPLADSQYPMDGGIVVGTTEFGGGSYFTNMYPGMFVLAADGIDIKTFSTDGDLGADDAGQMTSGTFQVTVESQLYTAYWKCVDGAIDPSVNHLMLIPGDGSGVTHTPSADTNSDVDVLDGLSGVGEIYYILIAKWPDVAYTDVELTGIATRFLAIVSGKPLASALADLNTRYAEVMEPFPNGGPFLGYYQWDFEGNLLDAFLTNDNGDWSAAGNRFLTLDECLKLGFALDQSVVIDEVCASANYTHNDLAWKWD